jgi:hypothetical protein
MGKKFEFIVERQFCYVDLFACHFFIPSLSILYATFILPLLQWSVQVSNVAVFLHLYCPHNKQPLPGLITLTHFAMFLSTTFASST